ncbi:cutinase family protein [Nocardia sp. CDC159]|uniref:Cutinase family protein n=1 Tax=Nocardia pulmonis TaxID=2951408 RepID=A0A9X2IWK3_9NOCA|nr:MULTISPECIES: cutinase family protein [Nocardia]MCM6774413.1 cutinase family protein [Nocardia pulmonis]MCM6787521.1 cutinase family protein [Nocardia sp. CDC159]
MTFNTTPRPQPLLTGIPMHQTNEPVPELGISSDGLRRSASRDNRPRARRGRSGSPFASCVAGVLLTLLQVAPAAAQRDDNPAPIGPTCPALYVLAVQGPDETSPDADPSSDTGALGHLFTTLLSETGDLVQRVYVRYTEYEPYEQASAAAATRLESIAHDIIDRCPTTKIAATGYGQGAVPVATFARRIGTGASPISADTIAAVALFAHPQRPAGAPVLVGAPTQDTPGPVPGTSGTAIASVRLTNQAPQGEGIDQNATAGGGYGTLTGRVADFCSPGDMTCDTPPGSPLAQTVRNIAAQSDIRDPVAAIATVAQALAATAWKTAAGVVTEDLSGTSLDQLSYQPSKSLGQRLAEASDPSTPMPGPDQALAVLFRLGTIGLNTVVTVAQKVLTPATIAELATIGLANPAAAIANLGAKVAGAIAELIPPQTALGWVNQAFDAITTTVTDQSQLYSLAMQTQYSDTAGRHSAYTSTPADPSGKSPLTVAANWFAAAAHDLAAASTARPTPKPRAAQSLPPTATSHSYPTSVTAPGATTTPSTAPAPTEPGAP